MIIDEYVTYEKVYCACKSSIYSRDPTVILCIA